MHKSVRLLSLLAALLAPFATLAQEAFPLTGRVVDSLLRSVPTAVVATLAPDSEAMLQHAVTDDEGRFTLSASGRVRLFVSCLGFAPYIGEPFDGVRATDVGELRLEGTAVGIDDVVVVAFGTQKKESLVGAVQVVRPSTLKVTSSNLSTSFAGKIAGVI